MSGEALLLLAIAAVLAAGLVVLLPLNGDGLQRLSVALFSLGAALGIAAAVLGLSGAAGEGLRWGWNIPGAELLIRVDALSGWFLVPIFLVPSLGACYGLEYWRWSNIPPMPAA